MTHIRDSLYLELEQERLRQERKWGIQHHSSAVWVRILGEEFGEVCKAGNESDPMQLRKELVECAAVCMAAVEDIDTSPAQRFRKEFGVRQAI